jgi:phosphotransferase system enzyme I (PtsP)
MAADRGNTQLSDRFDPLSVPFLRVLKQIADAGHRNRKPVTLCGEMAGKPISAMALIGLGYRSISMSPASVGPVKAMLTELPAGELATYLEENLSGPSVDLPMRALLQAFADDRSIPL